MAKRNRQQDTHDAVLRGMDIDPAKHADPTPKDAKPSKLAGFADRQAKTAAAHKPSKATKPDKGATARALRSIRDGDW